MSHVHRHTPWMYRVVEISDGPERLRLEALPQVTELSRREPFLFVGIRRGVFQKPDVSRHELLHVLVVFVRPEARQNVDGSLVLCA